MWGLLRHTFRFLIQSQRDGWNAAGRYERHTPVKHCRICNATAPICFKCRTEPDGPFAHEAWGEREVRWP